MEDEKARYETHNNGDAGHRRFLQPFVDCVRGQMTPSAQGLDWGCGPVPVLREMFGEVGLKVEIYDPFFGPALPPLPARFDFVTATEVVEHFRHPKEEFFKMSGFVRAGGHLFVMTRSPPDREAFEGWDYRRDPTHLVFYTNEAMNELASRVGLRLEPDQGNRTKGIFVFRRLD